VDAAHVADPAHGTLDPPEQDAELGSQLVREVARSA
jgi:hypothetical protein